MARRPRVLLLAPHWPPDPGAAAARLSGLARELRALGHELRAVGPSAPGPGLETALGGSVRRVAVAPRGRGAAAHAAHQARLWRALRDGALAELASFDAELVLVSSPPPLAALAGLGLRGRSGAVLPLVVDVRDLWPDVLVEAGATAAGSPSALALRFVESRLLDAAAAVTTVTETKQARLRARTARPVVLVPNGVDAAWVGESAPARRSEGPFEILYAGNVGRAQDVGLLVAALARTTGLTGTVVGDGEERDAVAEQAKALRSPVNFHPPEPRAAVRERLSACGCAFVTLRTAELVDAVPSKLLEAMALGVPVILAAAGEAAAILERSGGGVVTAPGDARALASALTELAARPAEELRAMGLRGRAHVLERYRREDAAARLSRLLQELAA